MPAGTACRAPRRRDTDVMFERRLTWLSGFLTLLTVVIVARLAQLQLAYADYYDRLADRLLTVAPQYQPAPRGAIRDRHNEVLVADVPTFDVCVHYGALADDKNYLSRVARALRRRGDFSSDVTITDLVAQLRAQDLPAVWARLAALTGHSVAEIQMEADRLVARIKAWRERAGQPVREEDQHLPLLTDLDDDVALQVRLELERWPWIIVRPGARRVAHNADAFVHVLGRVGAASPERIAEDPRAGDELHSLRPGDTCGLSGIEYVADQALRGARGRIQRAYDGSTVERREPQPGGDVHLTLDAPLQRQIYTILAQAVEGDPAGTRFPGVPESSRAGAAAVVIDVATREVLALVSYPGYYYERYHLDYDALRRDLRRRPLRFRAVSEQYPPGSTCKLITLVGGLAEGVVTPETHFSCTGYLLPNAPNTLRCWIYNQNPGVTHDLLEPGGQDAEHAVKNSCNIYFFQVGQRLGAEKLCNWFERFGLGHTAGTGLLEETSGIVPDEAWLRANRQRDVQRADAWNYAIGQGEVTVTPLQAANVAASVAAGFWAPVRLAYDGAGQLLGDAAAPPVALPADALAVARRGMWRVVNERGGTATAAQLNLDGMEMCGKTGSAQAVPRVIDYRYVLELPDGQRREVIALTEEDALAALGSVDARVVGRFAHGRLPELGPDDPLPSHAWFIGFTQPATRAATGVRPTRGAYAISVLIEYGGSGGHTAAPVAREIAEAVLKRTEEVPP